MPSPVAPSTKPPPLLLPTASLPPLRFTAPTKLSLTTPTSTPYMSRFLLACTCTGPSSSLRRRSICCSRSPWLSTPLSSIRSSTPVNPMGCSSWMAPCGCTIPGPLKWLSSCPTSAVLVDSKKYATSVHVLFTYGADPDFLKNDIRVKPDLDALGSLGDIGWYCIRAILWAANFELPKTVIALRDPQLNEAGVILSCGASLYWEDGKSATFHCSFLSNLTMDITAIGTKGSLHVHDFVIPYQEKEASFFAGSESGFNDLVTAWSSEPSKHIVTTELPQEAQMVREFARLVGDIRFKSLKPEKKWPTISRKTQLVVDAVKASIEKGFEAVHIQEQASVAVLSGLDYLKKNLMGRST
ncbi:uncharacterized oxidoreductase At4g09670-like isoform X3 [Prosopis cineraria]|uniref:uncharacterized oxidoreductase At4g09670-like isoform X3 n=1 Tax=Prosopis cineraria TaxID=364024 RepID=UPI00240EE6CA|nr:uncharacterized oxidoreductase At4g09670-like isoform X3 [Prosopis cineraria]